MRSFVAGIALIVVLVAAGCGGSSNSNSNGSNGEASKSATQALADAVKAADSASSLRLAGSLSSNGVPISIDLSVAKDKGANGSITLKGQKVDLLIVGSDGYMKADSAFWTQFAGSSGATIAQLLAGRWLKFPVNTAQFQGIVAFSNPKAIFDSLQSGAGSKLKNEGATTYKGQSVVALNDGSAERHALRLGDRHAVSGGSREDGLERRRDHVRRLEQVSPADGADERARLLAAPD